MAKYRLTEPHYIGGRHLPAGTTIGEDTPYPYDGPPSIFMVPLDSAAEAEADKLHKRVYNRPAPRDETTQEGKHKVVKQQGGSPTSLPPGDQDLDNPDVKVSTTRPTKDQMPGV